MDKPTDRLTSAPRLLQMNCGLFNTGSTDVTAIKVPSVGNIIDFLSQFSDDSKMADAGDFLKDNAWMPDSEDEFWSFRGGLAASDDFLEVFADLTDSCDFLFEGSVIPDIPPVSISSQPFSTLDENVLQASPLPSVVPPPQVATLDENVLQASPLPSVVPPPQVATLDENVLQASPLPSVVPPPQVATLDENVLQASPLPSVVPQVAALMDEKPTTKKRTASDTLSDSSNPDHDDYTVKFKKPAVAMETHLAGPSSDKHRSRRVKNNIASKQSRFNRKQKYVDMEEQAGRLMAENEELRKKAEKMEELTKEMKKILVECMVQKKGEGRNGPSPVVGRAGMDCHQWYGGQ